MTTPDAGFSRDPAASAPTRPAEEPWDVQLAETLPRASLSAPFPHDTITEPVPVVARSSPPAWDFPSRASSVQSMAGLRQAGRPALVALVAGVGIGLVIASIVAVIVSSSLASWLGGARASTPLPVSTQPLPTATPSPTPAPTATSAPTTAATFVATDTTTQGAWQGVYGGQGAVVVGDSQQLPAAIQVTPSGEADYTWAPSTADPRAPQKVSTASDRIAACWYSPASFTIDVAISDGQTYQLALYVLDWDSLNRSETVTLSDPSSGAVLDTRAVTSFTGGQYLVWKVSGHVTIQVTNDAAGVNAVVNGLFFANG